jgi:hypothetical protein
MRFTFLGLGFVFLMALALWTIFANYRATGRSLAHGLCLLKRREKRRCCFSTQSMSL